VSSAVQTAWLPPRKTSAPAIARSVTTAHPSGRSMRDAVGGPGHEHRVDVVAIAATDVPGMP
jgi:hypothetical protein